MPEAESQQQQLEAGNIIPKEQRVHKRKMLIAFSTLLLLMGRVWLNPPT
jgi:predicted nucleic acid-binding Zn ribbon protein